MRSPPTCLAKPLAIGANCGVGASDLLSSVLDLHAADPAAVLVAKANCGIPVIQGEKVVYSGTPETMAKYACLAIDAGARIIGGCCGTACDHLAAMRKAIDSHVRGEFRPSRTIEAAIGANGQLASGQRRSPARAAGPAKGQPSGVGNIEKAGVSAGPPIFQARSRSLTSRQAHPASRTSPTNSPR